MTRPVTILTLLILYVLTIAGLTIYHAYYFSDYVNHKGQETIDYSLFLLLTSVLFQGLVWFVTKTLDWMAAILSTVINFVLSFIIGYLILMGSGLSGIPRQLIFLYGGCYLTIFIIVTVLQADRLGTKAQ